MLLSCKGLCTDIQSITLMKEMNLVKTILFFIKYHSHQFFATNYVYLWVCMYELVALTDSNCTLTVFHGKICKNYLHVQIYFHHGSRELFAKPSRLFDEDFTLNSSESGCRIGRLETDDVPHI